MKRITIAAMLLGMTLWGSAQRMTANFEDGTTMEYELLSNSGDDLSPVLVTPGATYSNAREGLKIDYFNPEFGTVQLRLPSLLAIMDDAQKGSWSISGLYFLNEKAEVKAKPITLMSTSSGDVITKYRTETPIERISRFGAHGRIGFKDTRSDSFVASEWVTYSEIGVGLGIFRSQHIAIMREMNGAAYRAQGTASMQLTADALIFLGTEVMEPDVLDLDNTGSLGFEVAWLGRTSFWGKRDWGLWLTAGAGVGPVGTYPVLGGGIYFGYGSKL